MIEPNRKARRNYRRNRRRASGRGRTGPLATAILIIGVLSAIALGTFGVLNRGFQLGTHAEWRELVKTYEQNGEPIYYEDVIPPELPSEQNFFSSATFAPIVPGVVIPPNLPPGLLQRALYPGRGIQVGTLLATAAQAPGGASLEAIADILLEAGLTNPKTDYLLAGDRILAAIEQLGLDFTELTLTADRPGSQFPINYFAKITPDLPHLPYLEALGDWLVIKTIAEISTGDTEAAAIDSLLIWRLAASVSAEPFLPSQQTRRKLLGLFVATIRSGLQRGAWTDEQLIAFSSALEHNGTLNDFAWALRGERSQLNSIVHTALSDRKPEASAEVTSWLGDDVASLDMTGLRVRQVAANRAFQHLINTLTGSSALSPTAIRPPEDVAEELPETAEAQLDRLAGEAAIFAQVEVSLLQARLAVALERYRLATGEYPEELEAISPDFIEEIPNDPVTGELFAYRRDFPTSYLLSSPGWPGEDGAAARPWAWSKSAD
ncbi:MAG: hypothetical protein WA771_03440 [Chthoniobacterales bacterium]